MRSVAWRVLLACLAVAGVAVGTVAYIAGQATDEGFRAYVQTGSSVYAQRVSQSLADYYTTNGTWRGVENLLPALMRPSDDRLVVADDNGTVVADSAGQAVGRPAAQLGLGQPTPITVEQKQLGSVYLPSGGQGRGAMMGGGPGRMMPGSGQYSPAAPPASTGPTPEDVLQASVSRGLLWGSAGAVALAIVLSLVLTRQIVRPLDALASASRRLAAGDLSHRVPVQSRDEVGAVAAAFNAMAESLERNERARRNLLADIAHELRTPLTVIEGTADGILDGVLDPTPEQLGIIKEEAELLANLVGDLRDLSLAEAGQLRLDRASQDLAELVGKVTRGFEPAAQGKGLQLVVEAEPDLPHANVDARRLAQAVGNLVSNAVRHTPAGGRVLVNAERDRVAPNRALISVADSGQGISAEDLPHVFERFYRADKSRSRRSGGSGLGLAIAKQLVEAHGGSLVAQSEPGQGSTFTISLPL